MFPFSSIEKAWCRVFVQLSISVWNNCISKSSHENKHNEVLWSKTGNYTINNVFHVLNLDFFLKKKFLAVFTPHVKNATWGTEC